MDPNECWRLLLQAVTRGQLTVAGEHAENLNGWIARGGFFPRHHDQELMERAHDGRVTAADRKVAAEILGRL